MTILIVSTEYPGPGSHASAYVQARVDLYRRMGHEVRVITQGRRVDNMKIANRGFIYTKERIARALDLLDGTPVEVDPDTLERCPVDLSGLDADVACYHTPSPFTHKVFAALRDRMPSVIYAHGFEAMDAEKWGYGTTWEGRVLRFVQRKGTADMLRGADAVVVASEFMKREVRSFFPRTREPHVIPNPVDPDLFYLSRHEGDRGVCIRGKNPKYGEDLLRQADGHGAVDILRPGHPRSALPRILDCYAFFVAPARVEGQGVLMCEAAAMGMPILATNVCAIPEFIGGPPHVLVPPTVEGLRDGIRRMRGGPWWTDNTIRAARERILRICGPKATVERDMELFRGLAN